MTNEEIDALNPGREMDVLVADIVFEYECQVTSDMDCSVYISGISYGTYWDIDGELVDYDDLPHYSTSIADAWKVVERFRENSTWHDGFHLSESIIGPEWRDLYAHPNPYAACFDTGYGEITFSRGDTPMEAICKSALKAMNHV